MHMIVLYSTVPSPDLVLNALQQSFLSVSALNLVLNTSKTKVMLFGKKHAHLPTDVITTFEGLELEVVPSYKYLAVWLDGILSFSQHMQAEVKSRHGFLYRNCSSSCQTDPDSDDHPTHARLWRSAGKGALERLDILYQSAIRFATNAPYRTHHCTLYSSVNWSSLYTRRKTHWLMLI